MKQDSPRDLQEGYPARESMPRASFRDADSLLASCRETLRGWSSRDLEGILCKTTHSYWLRSATVPLDRGPFWRASPAIVIFPIPAGAQRAASEQASRSHRDSPPLSLSGCVCHCLAVRCHGTVPPHPARHWPRGPYRSYARWLRIVRDSIPLRDGTGTYHPI